MYRVLGLSKTANTEPEQEYQLAIKDLEEKTPGYMMTTKYGSEAQVRAILKNGGMNDSEIDLCFARVS